MVHSNNLVIAIKVNGKVLREFGDTVYLPFGCEYSIYIKNLSDRKASVDLSIDGESILGYRSLIVDGNSDTEVERFLGDDLNKGYKLKFIERSDKVEEHRGVNAEDGVLVIKYKFERSEQIFNYSPIFTNRTNYSIVGGDLSTSNATYSTNNVTSSQSLNFIDETGLTVEGNDSNQSFSHSYIGQLEMTTHTISLSLKGETEGNKHIRQPVTTKSKIKCKTCGTKNKAKNKFCKECGTRLLT